MNKMKKIILGAATLLMLVGCGGVNNNISFSLNSGVCADGTANAPYCMAVTIQNNAGGQNFITSTNFPIQNLSFSVTGPNNVNYPVGSGSAMDPNGCVSSTVAPGGTCTFYLQLTGESAPVGPKVPVTVNVNYTINNTLFGGSNTTASSSFTVYEYPAVVISSSSGNAQRYTNGTIYPSFSAESLNSGQASANAQDNYYGFLYLIGNGNIFASGTESFSYNLTESTSNVNNIFTLGNNVYPISNTTKYQAQINPLKNLWWGSGSSAQTPNLLSNVSALGTSYYFLSSSSQVFWCSYSASASQLCGSEGAAGPGAISSLGYTSLGGSYSGVVIGAYNGVFAESGVAGQTSSISNSWIPVTNGTSGNIVESITAIVADNNQNLYIAGTNNLYELSPGSGNSATYLAPSPALSGNLVKNMVYDNAGKILYVGTSNGSIYGCGYYDSSSPTTFTCGLVANSVFNIDNILGMNIITSLLSN